MKTRNIFIDTQAFMQQGLKFESKILARIRQLARSQLIHVYISEVVKNEVEVKIKERALKALQHRSNYIKELDFYESKLPDEIKKTINYFSDDSILEIGISIWRDYLESSGIQVLDSNEVCNKELLAAYFNGDFPFSSGKKKNEFPDAISLLSLKAWLNKNDAYAYVISSDNDLKGFCEKDERCTSLSHLSEFLDIYNRAEERLTNVVHGYIEKEIDWILEVIKDAFTGCGFEYSDNYEADVDNVEVKKLDVYEVDIIEVEDGRAVVDFSIQLVCTADVSGPDYDSSIWDSEDKEYIYISKFDSNMEFEDGYTATVELLFDEANNEITEVLEVLFDGGLNISLHFDDGFPYK